MRVVQEVGWTGVPARLPVPGQFGTIPERTLPRLAIEVGGPAVPGAIAPWSERRLEREYFWHHDPGASADSLLAQQVYTQAHVPAPESIYGHDTSPTLLYALTDSEGSVVGLADEIGQLVCQYAYTPFGELCHSEVMATGPPERLPDLLIAAAGNRIGHQGLRFERYDTPWAGALQHASVYPIGAPQTIPADAYTPVHGQYHNRNRMYSPALGRFLSRDPNALGTPVLSDLSFGGMALDASDVGPDLTAHYADGLNTHAAYGGNPLTTSDASGLSYAVDIGITVGEMASDLVGTYSVNMEDDLDWALDWSQPDDAYSRLDNRWVTALLLRHAASGLSFGTDVLDDLFAGDAEDDGLQVAGLVRGAVKLIKRTARIGGRAILRAGQLHHALPRYIAKAFGVNSRVLIRLPTSLHKKYHEALDRAVRALGAPRMREGAARLGEWIRRDPANAKKLLRTLKQTTRKFGRDHNIKGLDDALMEAMGLAGLD